MLDHQVQCFLESESCPSGTNSTRSRNNAVFGVGLHTWGIRVKCQRGNEFAELKPLDKIDLINKDVEDKEDENENENEEDELIWWSWDGKLVGFTD